jgi:DeoR/GlpR family transcriptional regulator of sugar metabolism
MNVRALLPEERRRRIAQQVRGNRIVTVSELEDQFDISAMTARRDLKLLEQAKQVRRIHGGAVVPDLAADEDSFQQRLGRAPEAKERLAASAVELLDSGASIFLDSSTTAYFVAKRLVSEGPEVTILTNSVPVIEMVATSDGRGLQLIGLGGSLRKLTSSFVGPLTIHAVAAHLADVTFLSVKGVSATGQLTDPDPLETEVKRAMVHQCHRPVLLFDGSKLDRSGMCVVSELRQFYQIFVTDASTETLAALPTGHAEVHRI